MSTKTSRKMTTIALAGAMFVAIFAAVAFTPASVLAQESEDEIAGNQDNQHRGVFSMARGAGIATDATTGDNLRTAFKIVTQLRNDKSTSDKEHEIVRGHIVVNKDGERVRYALAPETWQLTVAEDGHTFDASGIVKDKKGNVYSVKLTGYFGIHTRGGNIWSLEGSMTGGDIDYKLHYAAITNPMAMVARR